MDMTPQTWPDWYDGRHINEVLFCQQFLDKHPMKCVRGRLFTVDGLIEDEGQIGNLILEEISGVLTSGLSKVVINLLASIKLQAYSPPLPIETDRIHVANGTYFMDGSFTADKSYCNNRLTVAYNPDAPEPKRWLQFLSELPPLLSRPFQRVQNRRECVVIFSICSSKFPDRFCESISSKLTKDSFLDLLYALILMLCIVLAIYTSICSGCRLSSKSR